MKTEKSFINNCDTSILKSHFIADYLVYPKLARATIKIWAGCHMDEGNSTFGKVREKAFEDIVADFSWFFYKKPAVKTPR